MTKYPLMLTVSQLKLLQEVIVEYNPFYYEPEEVAEVQEITEIARKLFEEVTNPETYRCPDVSNLPRLNNSRGYHKC